MPGEYNALAEGTGTLSEYAFASIIPQLRLRWPTAEGRWVSYLMHDLEHFSQTNGSFGNGLDQPLKFFGKATCRRG